MMEKYGVTREDSPVEKEQLELITKLSKGKELNGQKMPKNAAEADDMIEKLAKETE